MNKLKADQEKLETQIANDTKFRADTAPIIERQRQFNDALKDTQTIQATLKDAEAQNSLDVQLGLKTQFEATQDLTTARRATIGALQDQLAAMQAIFAASGLDPQSTQYLADAKAIEQMKTQILQLSAALDPVGQALNKTFGTDLVNLFDKLGSGGVKTFKDLKTAALDFAGSIASAVSHEANQKLADDILKSLGSSANGATGTTGGLGGVVSKLLGFSGSTNATTTAANDSGGVVSWVKGLFGGTSKATGSSGPAPLDVVGPVSGATGSAANDPMGDFVKNLGEANTGLSSLSSGGIAGMAKGAASYVEKLITGTTSEVTAATATQSAATALVSLTNAAYAAAGALSGSGGATGASGAGGLLGGIGKLFGGGVPGAGQSALASTTSTAGASINAGVTDGALALFHGGGIVGEAAMTKMVRYTPTDVANAPRFHGGGVAGLAGYEQLAVLKKGEEVLTDDDPRHRSNGGRSRGGLNLTQNFTIQPTMSRASQAQVGARAASGISAGRARARSR